jgi:septum formation protein
MTLPALVLASTSPRRKQILGWLGETFSTVSVSIEEIPLPGEDPVEYVTRIAEAKAAACTRQAPFGGILVAADTTVSDLGIILGKPATKEDARLMLLKLRNRNHFVHTAFIVTIPSMGKKFSGVCTSRVKMRQFSESEIEVYVESGDPMDKAGGYAIQHEGFHPVEKFSGCAANVMGFPLCHFEYVLRKMGYGSRDQVPFRCQDGLAYTCPIFKRVLAGEEIG